MKNSCINCDHSNAKRTNDEGKIRCKKFHIYMRQDDWCQYHYSKEIAERLAQMEEEPKK